MLLELALSEEKARSGGGMREPEPQGGRGAVQIPRTYLVGTRAVGNSASLHILSTEGRGVGLCWAHSQPKGPKGGGGVWGGGGTRLRGWTLFSRWSACVA